MTRLECTQRVLDAKLKKDFTFQQIADHIRRHVVWTTSALLGQNTMSPEEAAKTGELLGLEDDAITALQQFPSTDSRDSTPPVDPLNYRFYEIMQVYSATLKAVVLEKFGDGIMSASDFTMDVERIPDPKGDRMRVTMDGKFLAYKKM